MTDIARYRKAEGDSVRLPVDSAQVIEQGDMVWLNADDVRPASSFSYVTSDLPGTQANFRRDFVGIAQTASDDGDTDPITVQTSGRFEMDCAAAQFEIGDLVGPDDNAGGDTLLDQQVIAIGENGYGGIMRVVKRYGSNTTRVLCEILPQAVRHPDTILTIPLGGHDITAAADFVTDLAVQFPFKLVALVGIVTVATTGALTATVDQDTTALDDTLTIPGGSAVGTVVRQAMDDATGDDRFEVGDNITLKGDGTPSAGEAEFYIEVRPFLVES